MRRFAVFISWCLCLAAVPAWAATTVETHGNASIAHDAEAGTWSLAAGGATLTLDLDPGRDFHVLKLLSPSGQSWIIGTQADTVVTIGGSLMS